MKKIIYLLLLSTTLTYVSCNSDDEPQNEPTVEEIQQDIHNTFDGFVTCMQGYENGAFSNAFQTFMSLNNGVVDSDYSDTLVDELGEFEFDLENFDMSDHSGVYNWNFNQEMWNFTADNENKLVFNFPSSSTGTSNNTVVTINNYSLTPYNLPNETLFVPTRILGSIVKDGNEIFNVDLDNVNYHTDNDIVSPVSFNLEIRTAPMTHTFTLTQNANNHLEFDYNSHNDNSCSTTLTIDASTVINDYAFVEDIEDFADVSGTIAHDNLEIRFNAQVDNLSSIDNPTAVQINQLIEAKVFLANSQIGELEYSDANDDDNIFIVFNDGTRENVTNYVNQELADQLEAIFANFIE